MKKLNALIRKHTAFNGMIALTKSARHPYTPTLNCLEKPLPMHTGPLEDRMIIQHRQEVSIIADAYDAMMQRKGLNKTAYRI